MLLNLTPTAKKTCKKAPIGALLKNEIMAIISKQRLTVNLAIITKIDQQDSETLKENRQQDRGILLKQNSIVRIIMLENILVFTQLVMHFKSFSKSSFYGLSMLQSAGQRP